MGVIIIHYTGSVVIAAVCKYGGRTGDTIATLSS